VADESPRTYKITGTITGLKSSQVYVSFLENKNSEENDKMHFLRLISSQFHHKFDYLAHFRYFIMKMVYSVISVWPPPTH